MLQFLSLNLPDGPIDTFHDGELFSVTKNTLFNNSFFIDTYTIHGFSDIFYPMFFWKLTGQETIGSGRLFFFFLILSIKLFSLILSILQNGLFLNFKFLSHCGDFKNLLTEILLPYQKGLVMFDKLNL